MEVGARPAPTGGRKAPAPAGGGAAAQVGQVEILGSGVSLAEGGDCFLTGAGGARRTLGPRIQLWEAGFVSQTLPRRKAMEGEGLRNFKELRAKFQNLDAPSLPGLIQFPAGVSQQGDIGSKQSTKTLASGKPILSSHNQPPPNCAGGDPQPLKPQKVKLAQRSEIQKCSNSQEPPGMSPGSAVNSQKGPLLLDMNQSDAEITSKKKAMLNNSFRDKLWNWEVLSQQGEMSSAFVLADGGSRAFHLEEQNSMGLTPEEPRKMLEIQGSQTLPSQKLLMAQGKLCTASKDPTLPSPRGRKGQENPSPERSPAGSTCHRLCDSELSGQAPEKQPDVRRPQLPSTKPLPSVKSLGPPPPKPPKPLVVNLQAFQRQAAALPTTHREAAVKEDDVPPESAELEEPHNYEATISYLRHPGNSINLCTAEEIADSTYEVRIEELQKPWKSFLHQELSPKQEDEDKKMKEKEPCELEPGKTEKDLHPNHLFKGDACEGTPGRTQMTKVHRGERSALAGKQDAGTDADILQTEACPEEPALARRSPGHCGYVKALEMTKEAPGQGACTPNSLSETYDDVECLGREGLKSDYSNSLASDNEDNSEEMYEDVCKTKSSYPKIDLDGKAALKRLQRFFKKEKDRFKMKKNKLKENTSNEDKLKLRKPKFLISKEKKGRRGAEESESSSKNFFKFKQNFEKNRLEREEKLFRERFKYEKEITVINTAVACSNNSRNGIFDLPVTPGEELEVIDTTEENLVICRNSKGKYGYVLIEHLDFKHQGCSP
ncbi:FYN-binding protein 2 isoform X3 [Vicugna pacos]|uniref:FYN-binding protein 2 isoform X3 n=1 Tax=Vicugna pacos TaxID=30538 RepID=A0ABM5EBD9_VICPA